MEELLNKLIERGWKPFGWKDIKRINNEWWFVCFVHKSKKRPWLSEVSHRELCAKESWLWQFVCENKLYKDYNEDSGTYWDSTMKTYNYRDYQYWLIESALKDESELEQFLLDNIRPCEKQKDQ